jgi:hypothetical protein
MWMLGRVCTISTPGIKKKKKKDLPVGMNRPFGQSSDSARFEWRPLQAHSRQQRETLESVRPTLSVVVEELEQVAAR